MSQYFDAGNETSAAYRMVKNFGGKKFGEMVLLKHWQKNFGESKACLYVYSSGHCMAP